MPLVAQRMTAMTSFCSKLVNQAERERCEGEEHTDKRQPYELPSNDRNDSEEDP